MLILACQLAVDPIPRARAAGSSSPRARARARGRGHVLGAAAAAAAAAPQASAPAAVRGGSPAGGTAKAACCVQLIDRQASAAGRISTREHKLQPAFS
jgi:hypothetical protein